MDWEGEQTQAGAADSAGGCGEVVSCETSDDGEGYF